MKSRKNLQHDLIAVASACGCSLAKLRGCTASAAENKAEYGILLRCDINININ